jgi:hypothetical protein
MNPLLKIAIQEAPAVIAMLRGLFQQKNPSAPVPTDAEVFAAFEKAFNSSLAKDNAWLAAHPE